MGLSHIHGANTDQVPVLVRSTYDGNTDKYGTNTVKYGIYYMDKQGSNTESTRMS